MSDTHVNAFYGAVDEALKEVDAAQAKYEAAKAALEAKKAELEAVPSTQVETDKEPAHKEDKKIFNRR